MTTATRADAFSLQGLSHRYGADTTTPLSLKGVDIELGKGEFVSLIGPSGCGKSTLIKIACGLLEPSVGSVLVEGAGCDPLGQVGYMPQNDLLMPWRTVLENTTVGLEAEGMPAQEAQERAQAQMETFGLSGFENHYPAQVSGGMRQRAALLRTLLCQRKIYVLDEPFGKLDSLTRLSMHAWLTEVWQQARATILFITHDLDEALYLSDRIYVMSQRPGSIVSEVQVTAPRPRNHQQMTMDPEIAQQKAQLIESLSLKI